ncbi:hypothetical protein LCGC14_2582910 [marine sediment metagenome]|uniref:4Fe-4S ferredoxin-type domain-containing protein n=1 Tax=marine sediment metagenome TaxID=412755 RepID=A0A0F9D6P9_9ZZZZ
MAEKSTDIYKELANHLDKMPIGYPATESGVELRVLEHIFTPEQGEIAIKLSFQPKPLKEIFKYFRKSGISIDELEQKLDEMYFKGLINRGTRKNADIEEKYYGLAPFAIGFYEYQLNHLTKEFVHDAKQYMKEAFWDEFNVSGIPQLRTIPLEQTVETEQSIATYDDLRSMINNIGEPIAVAECICRQGKALIGEPCEKTKILESCFSFRTAAKVSIERGHGREITKEEALKIIEKAEEDGLVLQPSNSKKPFAMCTCCGCCCGVLTNQKLFSAPAQFFATNFYAEVDTDLCAGCETCIDRCNMDAVHVEDAIAHVDKTRCIGCGVCVPTCTSEAMKLYKKAEEINPPENTVAAYMAIMDKKAELARAEKN